MVVHAASQQAPHMDMALFREYLELSISQTLKKIEIWSISVLCTSNEILQVSHLPLHHFDLEFATLQKLQYPQAVFTSGLNCWFRIKKKCCSITTKLEHWQYCSPWKIENWSSYEKHLQKRFFDHCCSVFGRSDVILFCSNALVENFLKSIHAKLIIFVLIFLHKPRNNKQIESTWMKPFKQAKC